MVTITYTCDSCAERITAGDRHQLVTKNGPDRHVRPSTDLCPACWESTKALWDTTASGDTQPTPRASVANRKALATA